MKKAALIAAILFVGACGGKKAPAKAPETPTAEHATPADQPPTAEKPAEAMKPAEPPKPTGPSPEELAKQALTEQVDMGAKVWKDKGCAKCHGDKGEGSKTSPPVVGDKALPEKPPKTAKLRKGVMFKTGKDVLDFVKAKMPKGKDAGKLTDEEAAAATAWIFSENKVTLDKKVDAESAGGVMIHTASAETEKAPDKPEKMPAKGKTPAKK